MPYIPKEHEKYNILPRCRKKGGEVFSYNCEIENEIGRMLPEGESVIPYNYDSYKEFYAHLDAFVLKYGTSDGVLNDLGNKILMYKADIERRNVKENWSVLKYTGETTDELFGFTHGRYYYWPCSLETPEYEGVIDNEEFTSYIASDIQSDIGYQSLKEAVKKTKFSEYHTSSKDWEIVEDPTGMAYRALAKKMELSDVCWYCDKCDAFLNQQPGFSDYLDIWKCRRCGYENIISADDIYESRAEYWMQEKFQESDLYKGVLVTPLGKVFLLLDGYPIEYNAIELKPSIHFPDVNGRYKIEFCYSNDNTEHSISCLINLDELGEKSNAETYPERGERFEALSFLSDDIKVTIGAYGEEPGYVKGVLCRDHDFDYDVSYLPNGLTYEIYPSTKSNTFVFGVSWIFPRTNENDHQPLFGAEP